jgi:hypothetical protein
VAVSLPARGPMSVWCSGWIGVGQMADDGASAPLSRRVPGAARPGPGQSAKPVLSDSVLNRMQAAIDAERAQAEPEHVQAEPEHLTTVPRYEDPNTEPLPKVTASASPTSSRAKRGRIPSGTDADRGVQGERARRLESVAEIPPDEEPLRVARALRAAEPEAMPPVESAPMHATEPALAVEPAPVRAVQPTPVHVVEPAPVRDVDPVPLRAAEPLPAPTPPPTVSSPPPPPLVGRPVDPVQPTRAPDDAPWWADTPAPEPGPTPGTIGWLWPEETAKGGGGGGGGPRWRLPRRWGYRAVTLVTLAAGVLVGAGLFLGIALHSTLIAGGAHGKSSPTATVQPTAGQDATPSTAPGPAAGSGANAAAVAADRALAASWIEAQVAEGTVVACDAQMCAALTASGFPAAQEVQLGLNSQSLSNATLVVMTPTLQMLFSTVNPSLGNEVTSAVLASFGQVSVQMIWQGGAAAYQTALSQDVQARIQLGEQLLNSGLLTVSPSAQSEIAAGEVDPRLLLALQSLVDQQPIDVLGFTDSGPGAGPGIPLRAVDLSTTDPNGGMSSSAYLQGVVQVLRTHATFPPYQKVSRVTMPDGQTAIQVQYAAPSPLGLLGGG